MKVVTGRLKTKKDGPGPRVMKSKKLREDRMEEKYRDLFGDDGYEELLRKDRRGSRQMIILAFVLFSIMIAYSVYDTFAATPGLVEKDGELVSVLRPDKGEPSITLTAEVTARGEDGTYITDETMIIEPYSESVGEEKDVMGAETAEEKMDRRIAQATGTVNEDRTAGEVVLPKELEDGTKLIWKEKKRSKVFPLLLVFALIIISLTREGERKIVRYEKEARASVIRELPEFMNRLVLLLSTGAVLESAFLRASKALDGETYFSSQMRKIRLKAEKTRAPVEEGFRDLARRSGVRELMRVSNIMYDNINKGTELADKLKRENSLLWFGRKKHSEEAGRIAETKLTLPLVILLLVLVLVTTAPAMMKM